MRTKILLASIAAALSVVLMPSQVDAYGAAHVGYTHVGPNGVYHTGTTAAAGPNGAAATSHTTAAGANGAAYHSDYHYSTAHTGTASASSYHYAYVR